MEKLVYKSGLTTIYECDNLYKIENADGYYMFTDRDERILEALKKSDGRKKIVILQPGYILLIYQ